MVVYIQNKDKPGKIPGSIPVRVKPKISNWYLKLPCQNARHIKGSLTQKLVDSLPK